LRFIGLPADMTTLPQRDTYCQGILTNALTIRYLFATLPFRDSSDNNSRVTELGLSPCLLKYSLNLELSETMEMALLLR